MERFGVSRRTACRILASETAGQTGNSEALAGNEPAPVDRIAAEQIEGTGDDHTGQPSPPETITEAASDQPPQPIEANQIAGQTEAEPARACHACRSYRGPGWTWCNDGWRQRPARPWCPHHRPTITEDTEQ
jgi:hypothetical protein